MFKKVLCNKRGFTFIELLVVISVTVILTTIFIVNTRETKIDDVNQAAKQILSDARYARSLATSRTAWNVPSMGTVFPPGGYGIAFSDEGTSYTIFAESGAQAGYQAATDGFVKTASVGTLKLEDANAPTAGGAKYFTFKSDNQVATNFAEDSTRGDFRMAVYYQTTSSGYKGIVTMGQKADDGKIFVSLGVGGLGYTPSCSTVGQTCDGSQPCCANTPTLTCNSTTHKCTLPPTNPPSNTSCLPAGTKILMADNSYKNIEDVQIGDYVIGYDTDLGRQEPAEVLNIVSPFREHMCEISFVGGASLQITNEHPIYTNEGWKSINPERTDVENEDLIVSQLDLGDKVLFVDDKYEEVSRINCWQEIIQTYNIESVSDLSTFFADGVLVHNASSLPGCSIINTDPASAEIGGIN